MMAGVKVPIKHRQEAFTNGSNPQWRYCKNLATKKIALAQVNFYENSLDHLRTSVPLRWHSDIQLLANRLRIPSPLTVPTIPEGTYEEIATTINHKFYSTSQS